MSPRGVAIPDLRERLFAAAERVVTRDGAAALTSRAVTDEAQCAKGVLHAHFAGLDEFVAALVLDRFAGSARGAEALAGRVGRARSRTTSSTSRWRCWIPWTRRWSAWR